MEEDVGYKNIESIIIELQKYTKNVMSFRKFDGITIECRAEKSMLENAMNEVEALSRKLNIIPVSVAKRKDDDCLFGVQYPELKPIYTDEEMRKMYNDDFKFLFDNIKMKDPKGVTRTILIENMIILTKHAITIYCKSNINQYKEKVEDYINNSKYRTKINGWYLEYIDEYLSKI